MNFRTALLAALAILLLPLAARADIQIINLTLTATSMSFEITGNLPDNAPPAFYQVLAIVNPDKFESPGFVTTPTTLASSISGPKSINQIGTGNTATYGDYFYIRLNNDLATGEGINGTFTAQWSSAVFDPIKVESLNFYWGSGPTGDVTGGTFLTSAPVNVPEPSTWALLGLGALVLGCAARRRQRGLHS